MAKKRNFTAEVAELEQKLFDPRGGRSRRTCHEEGAAHEGTAVAQVRLASLPPLCFVNVCRGGLVRLNVLLGAVARPS